MDVSVIIPVYNLENYIKKNIESMMCQEGIEAEFIYINDGSTDKSGEILAEYALKDSRIKIINQKNNGQSVARNTGIRKATGEWIVFIDGDDYIAKDSLKTLYKIQKKYQLDILLAKEILNKKKSELSIKTEVTSGKYFLYNKLTNFSCCLYSYRRQFLLDNKLFFIPGVQHEDMEFIPKALYYAKKIGETNYCFYHCIERVGSTTRRKNLKRSYDLFLIAQKFEKFIQKNNLYNRWWIEYIGDLYMQGIHTGILSNFPTKEILISNNKRQKICATLNKGAKKHKILSFFLTFHLDALYEPMYKFYHQTKT